MLFRSVHINRYEKDGQKCSSTEIKVEEIHFSGGKKKQNEDGYNAEYDTAFSGADTLF